MLKAVRVGEENGKLADFDLFWSVYPRKVGKLDAMKAWTQTKKHHPPIEAMLASVNKLSLSIDDIQFCPFPANWLRAGRFLDE